MEDAIVPQIEEATKALESWAKDKGMTFSSAFAADSAGAYAVYDAIFTAFKPSSIAWVYNTKTHSADLIGKGDYGFYPIPLYVSFEVTITVNFDAQGGTPTPNSQSQTGEDQCTLTVTQPTVPTKAGYAFQGWHTSASGGTEITFPYMITKTSDYTETLYAHWEPITRAKGGYIII
jgi:Listeria/Bacterioides repeat